MQYCIKYFDLYNYIGTCIQYICINDGGWQRPAGGILYSGVTVPDVFILLLALDTDNILLLLPT